VHRYEIYEEIKSSTLDAAKSAPVDLEGLKKKARPGGDPPPKT